MKPVNLRSIVVANRGLDASLRDGLYKVWGISPKPVELSTLEHFVLQCEILFEHRVDELIPILGSCFLGFVIPRISKEFDCLWIGDKTVVNVELKSQDVGEEKIKNQLVKNRYYLQHLNRKLKSYSYVSSTCNCYSLNDRNELVEVSFKKLISAVADVQMEPLYKEDIECLFPPEKFLVSPFNSTKEFLRGCYFLTNQQLEFKNKILQFLDNEESGNFCALTGGPGSGKTLLMYDIACTLMREGKNVVIGHSGGLNDGQRTLVNNGWKIQSTKYFDVFYRDDKTKFRLNEADFYMIDEAQRCKNLDGIVQELKNYNKKCLFAYDTEQIMSDDEGIRDNGSIIQSHVGDLCFKLTSNIRTNTAVYEFVKALFDTCYSTYKDMRGDVEITYCQNYSEAAVILDELRDKGFRVPKFTPTRYCEDYVLWFPNAENSAHEVIGQEFDQVAGILSDKMYYDENGKLVSKGSYFYREDRMLYQILSRARHKVHLVVVNNPLILKRCIKLVHATQL